MTHWRTFFSSQTENQCILRQEWTFYQFLKKMSASWHIGEPNLFQILKENQCMAHWRTFFSSETENQCIMTHKWTFFQFLNRKSVHHDTLSEPVFSSQKKISASWHIGEPFCRSQKKTRAWHIGEPFFSSKKRTSASWHRNEPSSNFKENECIMTHWRTEPLFRSWRENQCMTHWRTFVSSKQKTSASWHRNEPFSILKENQCIMTHWVNLFPVLKRKSVHHDTLANRTFFRS